MYIVLQEKQGRAAGHICLEEGQGELCWRGRCQGKAVLLSGEGERWLTEQGRCPFVPVGALVLEGETLLAWGNAPGESLTEQELLALYKEKNVTEKTEEPPEKAEKPEDLRNEPGSQVSSQPSESCKPCMEERENTTETPRETPAPEDSGAEAAAFAALVAEAAQVYRQLESGETRALQGPPEARKWMAETESLLSPARKASARESIQPGEDRRQTQFLTENPFPYAFPKGEFMRVYGPGILEHLEGRWRQGNREYRIIAVPGAPASHPPRHLFGFTRYVRSAGGGYWIKMLPLSN